MSEKLFLPNAQIFRAYFDEIGDASINTTRGKSKLLIGNLGWIVYGRGYWRETLGREP